MTTEATVPFEDDLPLGWAKAKLGDFLTTRGQSINPADFRDEEFELYSVPSFDTKTPEVTKGVNVGSSKQIVDQSTVLICKINPRINRSWKVGNRGRRRQIASTE